MQRTQHIGKTIKIGGTLMLTSSRNQFKGTVKSVKKGAVNDEIVIKLPGGTELTSIITETSTTAPLTQRGNRGNRTRKIILGDTGHGSGRHQTFSPQPALRKSKGSQDRFREQRSSCISRRRGRACGDRYLRKRKEVWTGSGKESHCDNKSTAYHSRCSCII